MPKNYKLRSGWKFWKGKKKKKKRKRLNLVKFSERKNEALRNQKNKSLINFDEEYSNSIKSIAVEQSDKVNLATTFLNGKRLILVKFQLKVYDLIDVFIFPNTRKICDEYNVQRCYLYQNLTDTDSKSVFFVFICDLRCSVDKRKSRDIIFKVMIKVKYLIDLIYHMIFGISLVFKIKNWKKQVGLFEIEIIDKPNAITIAFKSKRILWKISRSLR